MQCKVSFLTRKTRGGVSHKDEVVNNESILIGRSTDNNIYLADFRVSLYHAVIHERNGQYYIEAESGSDLRINGAVTQSGKLSSGDLVAVGPYDFIITQIGEELALSVELVRELGDDLENLQSRSTLKLSDTGISKRRWSWALFASILILFLAIPITAFFMPSLHDALKDSPVTTDIAWKSGGFADAHKFFANDCTACHQEAFTTVRDKACTSCHTETHTHADPEFYKMDELNNTRCATCHKEHNGPDGLVRQDAGLCSTCHKDLGDNVTTELKNAHDFGDAHPNFNASVYRYNASSRAFDIQREEINKDLRETSNLKFPHDAHLDPEGLDAPGGNRVMECGECHEANAGGVGLKPINMERHCIECHSLEFEPDSPGRTVPHGKLDYVLYTLNEYYGNLALQGGYDDVSAPKIVQQRRRPGQEIKLSKKERKLALDWAKDKSFEIGGDLFEGRVCSSCHDVKLVKADYPPKWDIAPVKVADTWLPKANFTHKKHETMVCLDCHAADKSETSEDVLIPAIDNCQQCHAGEDAGTNKLNSTCVDCHSFHIAEDFLLGDRKGMDKGKGMPKVSMPNDKLHNTQKQEITQ